MVFKPHGNKLDGVVLKIGINVYYFSPQRGELLVPRIYNYLQVWCPPILWKPKFFKWYFKKSIQKFRFTN